LTKIFLIRHAEAEGNLYRFAQGQCEGLITPRGYVQIEQLKKRFENEKIDAVYSSDLIRTQVTATSVTEPHGLPLTTSPMLREVAMGDWEEMPWGDIERSNPEMLAKFSLDPANWQVEGSEAYEDVIKRVKDFIAQAAERHAGQTIAIFCHGFAIRSFFCRLMGYASNETRNLPYCDNTAVALLNYENGEFTIAYQGDNSHLEAQESTFAQQQWWRDGKDHWKTENMRYVEIDENRDAAVLEAYSNEFGPLPKSSTAFATFLGDMPAGLVGFSKAGDDAGEIDFIFLMPGLRNLRFGIQLLGKAVAHFRRQKVETLRIKVKEGTPIYKLCKKHWFQEVRQEGRSCVLEKNIRNW